MVPSLRSLLSNPRLKLKTATQILSQGHAFSDFSNAVGDRDRHVHLGLGDQGIHEWFYQPEGSGGYLRAPNISTSLGAWYPPLTLLAGLVFSWGRSAGNTLTNRDSKKILFIGRKCWPTFQLLAGMAGGGTGAQADVESLQQCVFIHPRNDAERFWSIGEALRCRGLAAIIADGSRIPQVVSRRLQLAAESGGTLAFLARPPWEQREPSWAASRWRVGPLRSSEASMQWEIERIRGRQQGQDAPRHFTLACEVLSGSCTFNLSARVGRGTVGTKESSARTA